MRTCPWCGKELFSSARKDTIYCGTACRVATHRSGIPLQMLQEHRWVNWDNHKRPINPTNGHLAKSNDPYTWANHGMAVKKAKKIGFMLGGGIGCIDLDHAIRDDGSITTGAQAILDFYPENWIEISPSGKGFHIWGTAPESKGIRRNWHNQNVEFYSTGRYITITCKTWQKGQLLPL